VWKSISPLVVLALKFGAVSLMRSDMICIPPVGLMPIAYSRCV
jgi:hypothetical protein